MRSSASSCSTDSRSEVTTAANRRGRLFVVCGPSGVGKGTVIGRVLSSHPQGLIVSVSVTTRPPRPGEVDGREYRFVSDVEFDALVQAGALLEWAQVYGHRYGTPAEPVELARAAGNDVLLELDVQGATSVKERVPDAALIFLAPPSMAAHRQTLAARLRRRGTEDDVSMDRRLAEADREVAWATLMDRRGRLAGLVVNDDVEAAAAQVAGIIQASRASEGPPTAT